MSKIDDLLQRLAKERPQVKTCGRSALCVYITLFSQYIYQSALFSTQAHVVSGSMIKLWPALEKSMERWMTSRSFRSCFGSWLHSALWIRFRIPPFSNRPLSIKDSSCRYSTILPALRDLLYFLKLHAGEGNASLHNDKSLSVR